MPNANEYALTFIENCHKGTLFNNKREYNVQIQFRQFCLHTIIGKRRDYFAHTVYAVCLINLSVNKIFDQADRIP